MDGMQMMLKSFGIDPEKIKAEFADVFKRTVDEIKMEVETIKASQERIETKVDTILSYFIERKVGAILSHSSDSGMMDSMPEIEAEDSTDGNNVNGSGNRTEFGNA